MKAIVCRTYGSPDVLHVEETAAPTPADDQVLIRIRAASINPYDWHSIRGSPYIMRMASGLTRPKDIRVGVDFAGVVVSVGSKVTRFKPGDAVFGGCRGAFAEYACAADTSIVAKPANVPFEQAATVAVAGHTALQGLRDKGRIQRGHHVLVNGASGGVGTFAVQIAKSFGARVTGVCSTSNLDLVRSLGADRVIDYTREDFTAGSDRYDIVLDCHANRPLLACASILAPTGSYIFVGAPGRGLIGPLRAALKVFVLAPFLRRTLTMVMAKPNREDLAFIADLMKAEAVTPVIDRVYRLDEVSEAIRYLEQGHARGKVVITVAAQPGSESRP
jgi:NADPH:quinone reductase-like Zn-dependent oxidoreductase